HYSGRPLQVSWRYSALRHYVQAKQWDKAEHQEPSSHPMSWHQRTSAVTRPVPRTDRSLVSTAVISWCRHTHVWPHIQSLGLTTISLRHWHPSTTRQVASSARTQLRPPTSRLPAGAPPV